MIHERYPEFDPVLFEGTGLFDKKPSEEKPGESKEKASTPVRKPGRNGVSSGRPRNSKDIFEEIIQKSIIEGALMSMLRRRRAKSER